MKGARELDFRYLMRMEKAELLRIASRALVSETGANGRRVKRPVYYRNPADAEYITRMFNRTHSSGCVRTQRQIVDFLEYAESCDLRARDFR